jgi:hypothetical protein
MTMRRMRKKEGQEVKEGEEDDLQEEEEGKWLCGHLEY